MKGKFIVLWVAALFLLFHSVASAREVTFNYSSETVITQDDVTFVLEGWKKYSLYKVLYVPENCMGVIRWEVPEGCYVRVYGMKFSNSYLSPSTNASHFYTSFNGTSTTLVTSGVFSKSSPSFYDRDYFSSGGLDNKGTISMVAAKSSNLRMDTITLYYEVFRKGEVFSLNLFQTDGDAPDAGQINTALEYWNAQSFCYSHTFSGMPNGVYELSGQGFYRNGSSCCAAKENASNHSEILAAKLFGNHGATYLQSIFAGEDRDASVGVFHESHGFVPDNLSDAQSYMDNDAYDSQMVRFIVSNGNVTCGLRKDYFVDGDWTVFRNLQLKYVGTLDEYIADASEENPIDMSWTITNGDIASNNEDGWEVTTVEPNPWEWNVVQETWNAMEFYNVNSYTLKQTLADLPPGAYLFEVSSFYRDRGDGICGTETARNSGEEESNVYLFAGDKTMRIISILADASESELHQGDELSSAYGYVPNDMEAASAYFDSRSYVNQMCAYVGNGTLNIGVTKDVVTNGRKDWLIFNSFKLYFIGRDIDFWQDKTHYYGDSYKDENFYANEESPNIDIQYSDISGTCTFTQPNPNGLLFARNDQGLNADEQNYVIDGVCRNFVLTDGHSFATPYKFKAQTAAYERASLGNGALGTLCLPFRIDELPGGYAYVPVSLPEEEIHVSQQTYLNAFQSAIIDQNGTFRNTDVTINVMLDDTFTEGYLTGCFSPVPAPKGSYVLQNHSPGGGLAFYLVQPYQPIVSPFRAYFSETTDLEVPYLKLRFEDVTTGISVDEPISVDNDLWYDL